MEEYACPFCDSVFIVPTNYISRKGGVTANVQLTVLSIECPCGATFALTRGGRPHARSD